jgi:hypothetical protein
MSGFVVELWEFMRERKKFWLLPILLVLLRSSLFSPVKAAVALIAPA